MSAFENAQRFFHACETPLGWEGCKSYVADGAGFVAQSEPLAEVNTVQAGSTMVRVGTAVFGAR